MILLPVSIAKALACLATVGHYACASSHRGFAAATLTSKAPAILEPAAYEHYIDRFNQEDQDKEKISIPNSDAWGFLRQNIPWFDCPDKQLEETYYYRWWSYRKHLTKTPDGWVVTEFLPPVSWAGIYNTISCAAGHHLYEGRWLKDPQYAEDYARFWLLPEAAPRNYSFWAADAVHAVALATGNKNLEQELLPNLVANYEAWERTHLNSSFGVRNSLPLPPVPMPCLRHSSGISQYRSSSQAHQPPSRRVEVRFNEAFESSQPSKTERNATGSYGLFKQIDDRDGMEYSLGGSGYRPSINSYMYGDAKAIAAMAADCGDLELVKEFGAKASKIKNLVQTHLWNKEQHFFETALPGDASELCGVREEIGFIPWYFNLPEPGYETAWKQLLDPQGFAAPFGPTTAERRAAGFMHPENHDCLWNGPSWPYATTQTLVGFANLLDNYSQTAVTKEDYFKLLISYSRSQQKDGRPWVAEDLDADTGKWIVDLPRSVCYNHSGFADLIITGLVGLRPRGDNTVELKPLVPMDTWDWFCLDSVPYHGQSLTICWDKNGAHYGHGSGLRLYVNGELAAHRTDLGELIAKIAAMPKPQKPSDWIKYPGGPVLGGKLGTCFDVCLLKDGGKYMMYFSWRPKKSIAVVESEDGVHWGEPAILIGPTKTGWEDDINRPSVVKRGGVFYMWYTGQFNGHSSIGLATSSDGLHWQTRAQPVLEATQEWEKVAVMCPSVVWDSKARLFRMWFSGGEQYEPDAIGYATSADGIEWKKNDGPIFQADPANRWEQYKVTACQVMEWKGWYLMLYIGFRDIDHAQIGIARSRDGITNWERMKGNPIISPTVDGWDADACYKPFAIFDQASNRWLLWYNGRHGSVEQIGLATKKGSDLGF